MSSVRSSFESIESDSLAPYAVKSATSRGRAYDEPSSTTRTCFQRDRDRIIHSKAFRRLKHKTQVFVATESDHYRSRLTHSLEVAQISRHLARLLRVNEDLCEAVALAHDLGHTPFGHSGERELNQLMKDFGGFEHNLQSLRIVEFLEDKYPYFPGLNLSLEVLDGLMKHRTPWDSPPHTSRRTSLEAQICNLADEIAYNNHDLDDGLSSGLLDEEELCDQVPLWKDAKDYVARTYTSLNPHYEKGLINSYLISSQITNVVEATLSRLDSLKIESLDAINETEKPLVRFDDEMMEKNRTLRKFLFKNFYLHPDIYRMNKKGQLVIRRLFDAFIDDPKLLPLKYQQRICEEECKQRVVSDYIAGMTDTFALKEYGSLYT